MLALASDSILKAVTWSQSVLHLSHSLLKSLGSKELCRTCKKIKFSQSREKREFLIPHFSQKITNTELETSGYYHQNGILNFNPQYILNEDLISPITLTKAPLLFYHSRLI